MAERKINALSTFDPAQRRPSSTHSNDSSYLDGHDDVFNDGTTGSSAQKTCTHEATRPRQDSGFSSHDRSTISSYSDSRFSVHSWHTLSNKTTFSEHNDSVRSVGSSASQKNKSNKLSSGFLSKHTSFTSSIDATPSALSASSEPTLNDKALANGEQVLQQYSRDHRKAFHTKGVKGIATSYHEYSVEPSTMLGALKVLERRHSSGRQVAEPGQQVTFGSCSVGFFDKNGGRLTLANDGASLYIPPGAIKTPRMQMVYIYEIPSQQHEGVQLETNETWLTPTVECGPPGLEFNKDVLLSLPTCAINHSDWKVDAHRGKDSLESGKDTIIFLDDKRVTLAIDHFSPYKVSGRRSSTSSSEEEITVSKWMKAAVFLTHHAKREGEVLASFHLRLCNPQDWKVSVAYSCVPS